MNNREERNTGEAFKRLLFRFILGGEEEEEEEEKTSYLTLRI
jgi:hypothetical protein